MKKESDKATESVILSNNELSDVNNKLNGKSDNLPSDSSQSDEKATTKLKSKAERPRSLLFDKVKHFQNAYNGARSDSIIAGEKDKESKVNKSKLPLNSFRRSLNLDNLPEPPKFYKNPSKSNINEKANQDERVEDEAKLDRKNLKLDLTKIPTTRIVEPKIILPSTSNDNSANRNSLTTTDDSSTILSPCDDNMSDTWSVCSDYYHAHDTVHSPISPSANGLYSGDENESVIDRIRRKSFYTRFNEKKRPRRTLSSRNYNDLDLGYKSDYNSLDRRSSYDAYRMPSTSTLSSRRNNNYATDPLKDYKPYGRSVSLMNDYVNVPNRYQTYNSKIGRPAGATSSLYSDSEDHALDDILSTARSRKYSPHFQPSRLGRTSVSPVSEQYLVDSYNSPTLINSGIDTSADSNANPI